MTTKENELRAALSGLFDWCHNNVPYFGEHTRGSDADLVYIRAAKALGEKLAVHQSSCY